MFFRKVFSNQWLPMRFCRSLFLVFFFGVAATAIGDYVKPVIKAPEGVSHIILKMVDYVMKFAPLGVFGAISAVIAVKGLAIFSFYGKYLFFFVIGIFILWGILIFVGYLIPVSYTHL